MPYPQTRMPLQPEPNLQQENPKEIVILQINLNKSEKKKALLPKTHFGGRPGRTTTDAIHYLVHKIKAAWRNDQVMCVLFLDVEGAFPNAVTDRQIHNLKEKKNTECTSRFCSLITDQQENQTTIR